MKEYGEYDRGKAGICIEKHKKVYGDDKGEQGSKKNRKRKEAKREETREIAVER